MSDSHKWLAAFVQQQSSNTVAGRNGQSAADLNSELRYSMSLSIGAKAGVMKTPDGGKELLEKRDGFHLAVAGCNTVKKNGDALEGHGVKLSGYPAYFSVVRKDSRQDC
mgnify:CR=1 FL=1